MTCNKVPDIATSISNVDLTLTNNNGSPFYIENHCAKFFDKIILFQCQLFGQQFMIWIGESSCVLENIHMAIPREDGCMTCICGDIDSQGSDLAVRLSQFSLYYANIPSSHWLVC